MLLANHANECPNHGTESALLNKYEIILLAGVSITSFFLILASVVILMATMVVVRYQAVSPTRHTCSQLCLHWFHRRRKLEMLVNVVTVNNYQRGDSDDESEDGTECLRGEQTSLVAETKLTGAVRSSQITHTVQGRSHTSSL